MSSNASSFLLPDAEPSWQLWKSLFTGIPTPVDTPASCRENGKPLIVGLPATACRSVGLILPEADASLLPAMVASQLEKRGFVVESTSSPNFAWHLLATQHGRHFVSVDLLAQPFPTELVVPHASTYTAALRMRHLPPGELIITQEQDQIVLAFGQQGKLWHSHIIGSTETLPADLAREIFIAQLALEIDEPVHSILLVGRHLDQQQSALQPLLSLPLKTAPKLSPSQNFKLPPGQKLLPSAVRQAQTQRARRKQVLLGLLGLAAVYAALFFFGWLHLQSLQRQHQSLQNTIDATNAPASEVRTTAQRWRSLEPATEVERYPLVQLSHLTALMPPSGILLKKFTAKPDEIILDGDARDAQTATQFLEDLKKHPKLSRFTWNMPVPSMRNQTATFKITGKLQ